MAGMAVVLESCCSAFDQVAGRNTNNDFVGLGFSEDSEEMVGNDDVDIERGTGRGERVKSLRKRRSGAWGSCGGCSCVGTLFGVLSWPEMLAKVAGLEVRVGNSGSGSDSDAGTERLLTRNARRKDEAECRSRHHVGRTSG
jgi:hypothetical protein